MKKVPFISAVKLARADDSHIVPTTLYYDGKKVYAGKEARERSPRPELLIEEFKIALGNTNPDAIDRRSLNTDKSFRRTPVGLAKDFFDETLRKVEGWLDVHGLTKPTRILIAEPLALGGDVPASEAWLANYRKSIKRLLPSRFVEVDFLPEPFAVFQYYRYGLRHPVVAEHRKHVALVLDFGGGTFDVSVIETTKQGDISQSGVNSRPLAAKSVHIGGFFINRLIAEDALYQVLDKRQDKVTLRKGLQLYYDHRNDGEEYISTLSESYQALFRHMGRLLQEAEKAKIAVCNSIANWRLDADLSRAAPYPISVPCDPLSASSKMANVKLDAGRLREIFEQQVWVAKLRQAITQTLERAKAELAGQTISVVLLSGGSSNFRWLGPLLERDLKLPLQDAQILELSENFQEIVAKGLAVECARRFYTGGRGDFRAVTYNRLCLALRADDGDLEIRKFRPLGALSAAGAAREIDDGVLLPAASSLRGLTGQPLSWKVKLSTAPKRSLEYYFLRSSFDPEDLDALHNVASSRIFTPAGAKFQQSIEVELTVREDGTASPRFAYGRDNLREGTVVDGRPFFMDMTFAADEDLGETYLGMDFGTSTSACSYIHSDDVQFIEQRARSREWRDLADLLQDLPYPVAAPLARYMSETDSRQRENCGREAAEALLTFIAYVSYAERCVHLQGSALFKGLAHRSAGPLWALIKSTLKGLGSDPKFSSAFRDLVRAGQLEQIDRWVSDVAQAKHGKATTAIDYVSFLSILANAVARSLGEAQLGVFEGVTAKRFSNGKFAGRFRALRGPSQPFIGVMEYEGSHAFSDVEVVLLSPAGDGLNLSPMYIWGLDQSPSADLDLYEFDGPKDEMFTFKAVQFRQEQLISERGEQSEAWEALTTLRKSDQQWFYIEGVNVTGSN